MWIHFHRIIQTEEVQEKWYRDGRWSIVMTMQSYREDIDNFHLSHDIYILYLTKLTTKVIDSLFVGKIIQSNFHLYMFIGFMWFKQVILCFWDSEWSYWPLWLHFKFTRILVVFFVQPLFMAMHFISYT